MSGYRALRADHQADLLKTIRQDAKMADLPRVNLDAAARAGASVDSIVRQASHSMAQSLLRIEDALSSRDISTRDRLRLQERARDLLSPPLQRFSEFNLGSDFYR